MTVTRFNHRDIPADQRLDANKLTERAGRGREAALRAAKLAVPSDNPRLRLRVIGEGVGE